MNEIRTVWEINIGGPSRIDLLKMPDAAARQMGSALFHALKLCMENPDIRRECEEWKAKGA